MLRAAIYHTGLSRGGRAGLSAHLRLTDSPSTGRGRVKASSAAKRADAADQQAGGSICRRCRAANRSDSKIRPPTGGGAVLGAAAAAATTADTAGHVSRLRKAHLAAHVPPIKRG